MNHITAVSLPEGVTLNGPVLADHDRGLEVPLNPTGARLVTTLLMGQSTVATAARSLADELGIEHSVVEQDLRQLLDELADARLLNVAESRVLPTPVEVVTALVAGGITALIQARRPTRHRLNQTNLLSTMVSIVTATTRPLALIALLVAGPAFLALGATSSAAGLAALVASATVSSLVVHETAHALACRRFGIRPFLLVGTAVARIAYPTLNGRGWQIAIAGPLAPGLAGITICTSGYLLAVPGVVLWGLPWVAHLAALTVLSRDGRNYALRS